MPVSRFSHALYRAQQRAGLTGPEGLAAVVLVLALAGGLAARETVHRDAPAAPEFYAAADAAFVAASQRPASPAPVPQDTSAPQPAVRPAPGAAPTAPPAAPPSWPVSINSASTAELLALPGVGPVTAARIAEERRVRPFRDAADLQRVRGIGPAKAARIAPLVRF